MEKKDNIVISYYKFDISKIKYGEMKSNTKGSYLLKMYYGDNSRIMIQTPMLQFELKDNTITFLLTKGEKALKFKKKMEEIDSMMDKYLMENYKEFGYNKKRLLDDEIYHHEEVDEEIYEYEEVDEEISLEKLKQFELLRREKNGEVKMDVKIKQKRINKNVLKSYNTNDEDINIENERGKKGKQMKMIIELVGIYKWEKINYGDDRLSMSSKYMYLWIPRMIKVETDNEYRERMIRDIINMIRFIDEE